MLNVEKNVQTSVSFKGQVLVDGVEVVSLTANVSNRDYDMPNINQQVLDRTKFLENRTQCLNDIHEFEAQVYDKQAELLQVEGEKEDEINK